MNLILKDYDPNTSHPTILQNRKAWFESLGWDYMCQKRISRAQMFIPTPKNIVGMWLPILTIEASFSKYNHACASQDTGQKTFASNPCKYNSTSERLPRPVTYLEVCVSVLYILIWLYIGPCVKPSFSVVGYDNKWWIRDTKQYVNYSDIKTLPMLEPPNTKVNGFNMNKHHKDNKRGYLISFLELVFPCSK